MAHGADDTRQRLLEAAGEIFAERGFQAATVREICGAAGANLAAVNYHFGDKENLYVETVRHAHFAGADPQQPPMPAEMPPEEKLRAYVHRMLSRLLDPRRPAWHARLIAREMTEPTAACAAMVERYVKANFELLDGILQELLPPDTPAQQRHLVAFSIVGQCLHFKIHQPIAEHLVGKAECDGYSVERLTDHVTRFSLAALGRACPLGAPADADAARS
jgi:AcrR family transcriptional regulator